MLTPDQKTISGLSFPLSHNLDSLSQLIINVVSAIFNRDYTTTTLVGDHSDRLTCVASQRKEKREKRKESRSSSLVSMRAMIYSLPSVAFNKVMQLTRFDICQLVNANRLYIISVLSGLANTIFPQPLIF